MAAAAQVIDFKNAGEARARRRALALSYHAALPCPCCGTSTMPDDVVADRGRYMCDNPAHERTEWFHDRRGNVFQNGRARKFYSH